MKPCQIVIAAKEEQAAAFKAINGTTTPISIMALHAAALVASEPWAVQIAHVCACAQVELLRYPVPSDKKAPVMRDPEENWVNAATYRSMVQDKSRVSLWMSAGQAWPPDPGQVFPNRQGLPGAYQLRARPSVVPRWRQRTEIRPV